MNTCATCKHHVTDLRVGRCLKLESLEVGVVEGVHPYNMEGVTVEMWPPDTFGCNMHEDIDVDEELSGLMASDGSSAQNASTSGRPQDDAS